MRYLYAFYCVITFGILFLICFPFFLFFSLFGDKGRKVIWYIIKIWGYIWFFISRFRVKTIYPKKFNPDKSYIIVANHHSYLDTAMIFRCMPFQVKPLAKKELAKIPLFGFLYKQMTVLVDRNDFISKRRSVSLLKKNLAQGISIFIFPEGTFNETDRPLIPFYDGAFRIALQTQTAILPVIFPDTADRFHHSSFWKWKPGRCRAIFLPEIPVKDDDQTQIKALKEEVYLQMEAAIKKYGNK